MAFEIREVTREEERDRAQFLLGYSFFGDRRPEAREKMGHLGEMGPMYATFEDGEMTACTYIFALGMYIHGASVPLGGIAGVATLPETRRRGNVGKLMRHALERMHEAGQPLSALTTPHPGLYRRYGWMFALDGIQYTFDPKLVRPLNDAPPAGSIKRVDIEQWQTPAGVYERFVPRRNGYLARDERWWKECVFHSPYDDKRQPHDVAAWLDGSGEARGYVAYHHDASARPGDDPLNHMMVKEMVALDGDAFRGLLRYLTSHDLSVDINIWAPRDAPLLAAVDEPGRVKRDHRLNLMLRVVDVGKALAARPAAAGAPEGSFTLRLSDAAAPWNEGVWRIECSGGRMEARKADGAADTTTDAAIFAAMYNGYLRPSEAVATGLADGGDETALLLADRILAADYAPFCADWF